LTRQVPACAPTRRVARRIAGFQANTCNQAFFLPSLKQKVSRCIYLRDRTQLI
jgi:hypothetical protein